MNSLDVTKLSSKGQIVLPLSIRQKLGLSAGEQFVVVGDKDTIILKKLELPDMTQFKQLVSESRKWAKKVGLKKSDLTKAIKRVRNKSKN
jgi:antitoxin PrlF